SSGYLASRSRAGRRATDTAVLSAGCLPGCSGRTGECGRSRWAGGSSDSRIGRCLPVGFRSEEDLARPLRLLSVGESRAVLGERIGGLDASVQDALLDEVGELRG